jgi:hypothetical protein
VRTRWVFVLAAPLALASISCGQSNGLNPVRGKLLHKGQPAEGAVVYFHREGGDSPIIPSGRVDASGDFSLESGDQGSGAPAGKYAVLVEWPEDRKQDGDEPKKKGNSRLEKARVRRLKLDTIPTDKLKGRYSNIQQPLLRAEVNAGSNELPPFELTP